MIYVYVTVVCDDKQHELFEMIILILHNLSKCTKLTPYTDPKEIDFPRYKTKCSGGKETLSEIFCVVFRFPLHFVLYLGNLVNFMDRPREKTQREVARFFAKIKNAQPR